MKLIDSKAELIQQQAGLEGVYKQIEICGRTCYKSLDKITEDSAKPFVDRLINSNHTAMLEHGTVYLSYSCIWTGDSFIHKYRENPYSYVVNVARNIKDKKGNFISDFCITTNYRVIIENEWIDDLQYQCEPCEPTKFHHKRYTFKFITNRGVMAELTRHRAFSFSVESTRYCNYSKNKFNNELTFINTNWNYLKTAIYNGVPKFDGDYFEDYLKEAERIYLKLIKDFNWTPQQARQVLPNALKTEICMTGFASDWKHFFDLRYYGKTGKSHPDMELLASKAKDVAEQAGIWNDIMNKRYVN